jgi:hypothetical protein
MKVSGEGPREKEVVPMPGQGFGDLPQWATGNKPPKVPKIILAGEGAKIPKLPAAPAWCPVCDKRFPTRAKCNTHQREADHDPKFPTPVCPDCGKEFLTYKARGIHVRKVHQ